MCICCESVASGALVLESLLAVKRGSASCVLTVCAAVAGVVLHVLVACGMHARVHPLLLCAAHHAEASEACSTMLFPKTIPSTCILPLVTLGVAAIDFIFDIIQGDVFMTATYHKGRSLVASNVFLIAVTLLTLPPYIPLLKSRHILDKVSVGMVIFFLALFFAWFLGEQVRLPVVSVPSWCLFI